MSLLDAIAGRPLPSSSEKEERVGVLRGVAVFGLDALGSATYGPEAALTVLIPMGVLGLRYLLPLTVTVTALLLIVYVSYRQTIRAYPGGGGAYTVASQNLGPRAGLLAAAALMLDYILNVCVGISTGVGALISAVPRLQPHTLAICITLLVLITCANLRGTKDSGALWLLPTYLFVLSLLAVVVRGAWSTVAAGGHPSPLVAPPASQATMQTAGIWLLLRAFASGCTALTGVEAVSNGVSLFKEPADRTAKHTLTLIVVILAVLLVGIAFCVEGYGVVATVPGSRQYQSVIAMLTAAVYGRGAVYYVTIASVLCVLSLSANTSFAGFPQLCSSVAQNGYLPDAFRFRGRRLAHSVGILTLAGIALLLLVVFGGITDRLIPLFAIGAFLAFTFSQAGMVGHWLRSDEPHARLNAWINGVGAVTTATTVAIVLIAKFTEGAWITTALLAIIYVLLSSIHRHYERAARVLNVNENALEVRVRPELIALVPISKWNRASLEAISFAATMSNDVRVLHVSDDAEEASAKALDWQEKLKDALGNGRAGPSVIGLCSPYRALTPPLLHYIGQVQVESPQSAIAVLIAEVVAAHWYEQFLHNYRAMGLRLRLFLQAKRRIVIVEVPWQLPHQV